MLNNTTHYPMKIDIAYEESFRYYITGLNFSKFLHYPNPIAVASS